MAHFAELDNFNQVIRVVVVHNNSCKDQDGQESEAVGAAFCAALFGGRWQQTSYNGTIRKNFAGRDYIYDPIRDAFIAPKPYASWTLNETTCQWQPPVAMPDDGKLYRWDESTQSWVTPNPS
jgi:hypothetical protein